jgi:hypothetical protein
MMTLWSLTLYERPSLGGRIAHVEEEAPLGLIMYAACFCCRNNSKTIYLQPWRQVVRFRKKRKTANMKKNTYLFAGSNWFLSGLEPGVKVCRLEPCVVVVNSADTSRTTSCFEQRERESVCACGLRAIRREQIRFRSPDSGASDMQASSPHYH